MSSLEDYNKNNSNLGNAKRKNKVRMHIEPGKFLVSECGYFLTKVNYVNNRTNKNFIHVNSGLNHFVRPMFYGSKHAIENISSNSEEIKNYSVVGYICETRVYGTSKTASNLIQLIKRGVPYIQAAINSRKENNENS